MDKARERLAERFDCPLYTALAVLGGRWKPLILWHLLEEGPHRFLELKRKLTGVTQKVLTAQLKELQRANLVAKRSLPGAVPHTEYRATDYAESTRPVLDALCEWGEEHLAAASGAAPAASASADVAAPASARRL